MCLLGNHTIVGGVTVSSGNVVIDRLTIQSGNLHVITKGLTIQSGIVVGQGMSVNGINILSTVTGKYVECVFSIIHYVDLALDDLH